MNIRYQSTLNTPLGEVRILAAHEALVEVAFMTGTPRTDHPANELTREAVRQLTQYFAGTRRTFELPLAPSGTDFQRQAWWALRQIPYGETRNYAEQAKLIERPKAVRAVGAANGANPLAILVPCHRVIGKNGGLTGYAGGLERKEWLLTFERRVLKSIKDHRLY